MSSFRDRFLTPRVARAMTSSSAIVAVGAGAAAGILVGLGPVGAVAGGAAAWAARVLAAIPRDRNRTGVSPRSLEEPWRGLLAGVLDARRRFDDALRGVREGPLRDRLAGVGDRLDTAVAEASRVAAAGDTLTRGRRRIDAAAVGAELQQATTGTPGPRTDQMVAALRAQLDAAARLDATIADTWERLRLLDARMDEAVTRTVELSVTQAGADDVLGLRDEVDAIVGDMEALRLAVEETDAAGGATPRPGTGTA